MRLFIVKKKKTLKKKHLRNKSNPKLHQYCADSDVTPFSFMVVRELYILSPSPAEPTPI